MYLDGFNVIKWGKTIAQRGISIQRKNARVKRPGEKYAYLRVASFFQRTFLFWAPFDPRGPLQKLRTGQRAANREGANSVRNFLLAEHLDKSGRRVVVVMVRILYLLLWFTRVEWKLLKYKFEHQLWILSSVQKIGNQEKNNVILGIRIWMYVE